MRKIPVVREKMLFSDISRPLVAIYSAEWNHLDNFGRGP